jgi:hypothetical protein
MKKKTKKPNKRKQKIDVVLESLLNLEQRMKELINKVENLYIQRYYFPYGAEPKKYWPNLPPDANEPYWLNHNSDIGWDAIDKGLQ